VQRKVVAALRFAAKGEKAETAKPMKGLGSGIYEIVVAHRGDAFRTVYAVQLGEDIWATNLRRDSPVGCVLRTIVDPAGRPGIGA